MISTGTLIDGKYEVLRKLGIGGMGTVYAAVQLQFDRKVALKLLNTTLLQEPDGLARFEREAKIINAARHRNIVSFYGYGVWAQAPYMVMELIEGTSVDKLVRKEGKLDPVRAMKIIRQVFEALGSAHASGVIHRDMKPSNIMLVTDSDGNEVVKLIDFGLAKLMPGYGAEGQKLTETGYALGTCQYMPPEQALGAAADERADIYSTGCILYEMLTGVPPFSADDSVALMFKHINDIPAPLSKFVIAGAPVEALSTLINNCIAKNREDRYQSCANVIQDVDAILNAHFGEVIPLAQSQLPAPRKQARSRLSISPTVLLVLCLAAVGSLYAVFSFERQEDEKLDWSYRTANVVDRAKQVIAYGEVRNPVDTKTILELWSDKKTRSSLDPEFQFQIGCIVINTYRNLHDPSLAAAKRETEASRELVKLASHLGLDNSAVKSERDVVDHALMLTAADSIERGEPNGLSTGQKIRALVSALKYYRTIPSDPFRSAQSDAKCVQLYNEIAALRDRDPGGKYDDDDLWALLSEYVGDATCIEQYCHDVIAGKRHAHAMSPWYWLADCAYKRGNFDECLTQAKMLVESDAQTYQIARAHYGKSELAQAQQLFEKLHSRAPNAGEKIKYLLWLGRIEIKKQNYERANALVERAEMIMLEDQARNPEYLESIGSLRPIRVLAMAKMGSKEEAQKLADELYDSPPYVYRLNYDLLNDLQQVRDYIDVTKLFWVPLT
jgi:serine/threonine protein kinase